MTADISRTAIPHSRRYTGVVRQQGRLPLDWEENEANEIGGAGLRQAIVELVCSKGSPDEGFQVTEPFTIDGGRLVDFAWRPGSFYLAGIRLEAGPGLTTFATQPDWLTLDPAQKGAEVPAGGASRFDLVWLHAWEQVVSATEDSELLEPALGGPDTAARRRAFARVSVTEGVAEECVDAFPKMLDEEFPDGELDVDGCEILSSVKLKVGFEEIDPVEDLCTPAARAGFLGARNETFRVQITEPGHFIWGRDNAAPLYRVQVASDPAGNPRRLVFLDPPRDEFGWPLAGATVELLRWGARLDNDEKVAEPTGRLFGVEAGFDPGSQSIVLGSDVPSSWTDWLATASPVQDHDAPDLQRFFFLRVWTGGGEGAAVEHAFTPGVPVSLGRTGLTVEFSSEGMAGDHWSVSARPNTPTEVYPWALLDGAPPMGPRRLVAPLAILRWEGGAVREVRDCRHRFRPLCRIGGCCKVTVGDGEHSFGDVNSIQAAVDMLPVEGGEICLLEGEHEAHVLIERRRRVTLTGCGRNTRWRAKNGRAEPLLTVRGSQGVDVRRITFVGENAECIRIEPFVVAGKRPEPSEETLLEDLRFLCADHGAIVANDVRGFRLRGSRVALGDLSTDVDAKTGIGIAPAVYVDGERIHVDHNRIERTGIARERRRHPVGGLHVGGPSEEVTIEHNRIRGGNGHGITLGSIVYRVGGAVAMRRSMARMPTNSSAPGVYPFFGFVVTIDENGCIRIDGAPPTSDDPPDDVVTASAGDVRNVYIRRNRIADMGYSGISSFMFAGLGERDDQPTDAISVEKIEIVENRIEECVANEVGASTPLLRELVGWGGIALSVAMDATIRDNVLERNGTRHQDPVCGIFLAFAEDVKIERNRIEENGARPDAGQGLAPGNRAGIHVGLAMGGTASGGFDARRPVDRPALVVSGNIVHAPGARALKAILMGPCIVHGNRFTGEGRSARLGGALTTKVDSVFGGLARSGAQGTFEDSIDLHDYRKLAIVAEALGGDAVNLVSLPASEDLSQARASHYRSDPGCLRGGELMFHDNQVSLRAHSEEFRMNVSSVALVSADDVSFLGNQAEVEDSVRFVFTNTLVVAGSLRHISNRLQEPLRSRTEREQMSAALSALTVGMMNDTSHNQTTHCVFVVGPPTHRIAEHNRHVVSPILCQGYEKWSKVTNASFTTESASYWVEP